MSLGQQLKDAGSMSPYGGRVQCGFELCLSKSHKSGNSMTQKCSSCLEQKFSFLVPIVGFHFGSSKLVKYLDSLGFKFLFSKYTLDRMMYAIVLRLRCAA